MVEYIATFQHTDKAQVVEAAEFGGVGYLIDDGPADEMKAKYPEMPVWFDSLGIDTDTF